MERKVVDCDVKDCKNSNAKGFSFYKERRQDGAGSMEDWYYSFDLCQEHQKEYFQLILDSLQKDNQSLLIKITNELRITTREM